MLRPFLALRRALVFVFWRESIPGEFIASLCTAIWVMLSVLDMLDGDILPSIGYLAQVVPLPLIHGAVFAVAATNILAIMCSQRHPRASKWARFVCYTCLFFTWSALNVALAQALGRSPVLAAYAIPQGVYAYGILNILQMRMG